MDWIRIAEPQKDGYDLEMFPKSDGLTIAQCPRGIDANITDAPLDHPNIEAALNLLRLWPEGYASFTRLIHTFYPLDSPGFHGRGSTCGSEESRLGEMYATVYSVAGLAEAFVHECAHNKLRHLGIWLERADGLITNSPDELFASPIRKDKLRPMTAVFHAQYSYSYVTQLDLILYEKDEADRESHRQAIEVNYGRLREGRDVLLKNLQTDKDGEQFFVGYYGWLDRTLKECEGVL